MPALILVPDSIARPDGLARGLGVHVAEGHITAIGAPDSLPDAPRRPLEGVLLPGLVDLQVNGAGGRGVDEATDEALQTVADLVLEGGAASYLPTLISAPFDQLLEQVRQVAAWVEGWGGRGAQPLGLHVEGPFLEVPGAHPPADLIDPTPERIEALLEAAGGHLALVTLAPARAGAVEATARLVDAGVCVALGHAADPARLPQCVAAGARLVTHLFNAMSPLHHRKASMALAALDEPRLACSMISDGHHVRAEAMRLAWRLLGRERLVLITDSASPAGAGDGEYRLGSARVTSAGGAVHDDAGHLAGSAALMRDVVQGFRAAVPEADALDLAHICAWGPARLLGGVNTIDIGAPARFSVLGEDGVVRALVL